MIMDEKETLHPCPHCGGNMIDARLRARGFDSQVFIHIFNKRSPDGGDNFLLVALACTACGYVELHTHISEVEGD
jgi:predicted nucleic-acid-binding Zn-ribbon protein